MSEEAWSYVKAAREDLITVINNSATFAEGTATGLDRSQKIFQEMMDKPSDPINDALVFVKTKSDRVF